jgi:hypothetical protein
MPVIYTDNAVRFSGVVKYEFEPQLSLCRESVILNDSAATLQVGTVLGKVTATGKYKVARSAATDGSETPVAILIANVLGESKPIDLANGVDTKALVIARGPVIVADAPLTLGTGITLAAAKAALAAVGITVETAI